MKNLIALFITVSFLIAGCGGNNQNNSAEGSGVDITAGQLSSKIDPVCQMSLEDHIIADTVHHHGGVYGFCSAGCKEAFLADPHQFIKH